LVFGLVFAGLATVGYAVILQPDDLLVTAGGSVWGIGALTGNRAFVTSGPASVGTGPELTIPVGLLWTISEIFWLPLVVL
jgi:hypothetical protein